MSSHNSGDRKHSAGKPARQVVTLKFVLAGDGKGDEAGCQRSINIPFSVSEMIVRQVTTYTSVVPAVIDVPAIYCQGLTLDGPLCTVPFGAVGQAVTTSLNTPFMVPKTLQNDFRFRIVDESDPASAFTTLVGFVALTLEFRGVSA